MDQIRADFSGAYLIVPVTDYDERYPCYSNKKQVVLSSGTLNRGESASLGTGIVTSTLLAIERRLN